MKDVGGHDSPRGAVNQALIRGFPNGETRQSSWAVTRAWRAVGCLRVRALLVLRDAGPGALTRCGWGDGWLVVV
ncbi:hypothetical protein EAO77_27085 [Streptomyces sp. t39]|nr:hypothetical protein EAO77_27085 [Streptomyces sp. t39]